MISRQTFPEDAALLSVIKVCAKQKDVEEGGRLHADILKKGWFQKDVRIGNALVSLYAKCGAIAKAHEVFHSLPLRDVISWNALITGYSEQAYGTETMACFEQMQQEGFSPNAVTFLSILKACSNTDTCGKGKELHASIVCTRLFEENVLIGTALVDMYSKCGALTQAKEVFDILQDRNVISWTALIAGYARYGHGEEALNCFEEMLREGLSPNAVTFLCVMKACGRNGAVGRAREIHDHILRKGLLGRDIMLGNALVDMYAKCGDMEKAQEIFKQLPARNIVSWTSLVAGYAQHGHGEDALEYFEKMQDEGFSPNEVTYLCALKACGIARTIRKGVKIHVNIVREGLLERNALLGNALIDMYAKCGAMAKAEEVFENLVVRNEASWNALIGGFSQNRHGEQALDHFEQMQLDGFSPNVVTYLCALKACGSVRASEKGGKIHDEIVRRGMLIKEALIGTALVDMYGECGELVKAQEVFDQLVVKDVVSWTTLIAGYAQHGDGEEALCLFKQMQEKGLPPNPVAYLTILKTCGSINAAELGKELHAHIIKEGLITDDVMIGNALVDMYAKCGNLAKAQEVFDELPVQEVVSWNALIAGCAQHGHSMEAIQYFKQMQHEGLSPDAFTVVCVLKSCGNAGALEKGREVHVTVSESGLLKNVLVGNASLDMYTKCGALSDAKEMFDHLPTRDVVSWTTLIAGYAHIRNDETVVSLFGKMIGGGIEPDQGTFTVVLNACSHLGLLDKAHMYFDTMTTRYGFIPTLEHHACMLDLYGRTGQFAKVVTVIAKMPVLDHLPIWTSLLGACQKWGNIELGRLAFDNAVQLDGNHVGTYICMSNIYAAASMKEEAEKIDAMLWEKLLLCQKQHIKLIQSLADTREWAISWTFQIRSKYYHHSFQRLIPSLHSVFRG